MDPGAVLATEELEIDLLLEAVYQRYGFDFRAFDRASVRRKLHTLMQSHGHHTVSLLQHAVLHQAGVSSDLLRALSVQPALLFDDPEQARLLRIVLACLHASPVPKVWLPDCAGPEAAWSLAILLAEEQLHRRTEIYATFPSEEAAAEAAGASIPVERMEEYQEAYLKSGGTGNLAGYFVIKGKRATLLPRLQSRITWAQYNLVTDASPNEFQMIVCRRSLPDYGPVLRARVLQLFHDSLALFGVLGIDRMLEPGDALHGRYQPVFPSEPWYKRIA
jgi:chemotaxis protein methyltransferase CheR